MALWGYVNINVMKRNVIAFIVAILSAVNASAFDDVSTAYSFLDITSSSHVYGLGGVNVSLIDDDINIVEQNPALLGPELGSQLGVNYMRYIGSSNFAGVKYGHSAGTHGAWAASMQYFGYGEMKSTGHRQRHRHVQPQGYMLFGNLQPRHNDRFARRRDA